MPDSKQLQIKLSARDQASKTLKKFGDKTARMGRRLNKIGSSMTRNFSLPIAGAAGAAVAAFAKFDDKMNESIAIMGDVSSAMRDDMEQTARDVAKQTRISASEAAESYFFLASAGMDTKQSIEALPQVASFAQAGMFDMATATDLATDAQSAMGLSAEDAEKNLENLTRVTDTLVGANTLANASVEQFSESMTNKAGPALRMANKSLEEGTAILSVFADQGVKGQRAGERLNMVLRDLQDRAGQNSEKFSELGVEVFDAQGNVNNMADIIEDLENAMKGMSTEQENAILNQMGFTSEAKDGIKMLLDQSDAIREYQGELEDMAGITEEVADNQMESFAAQMDVLKSQFMDAGIQIGEQLIPVMKDLGNMAESVGNWFSQLSEEQINTMLKTAGLVAAAGPLLKIFGSLLSIGVKLRGVFAVLAGAKGLAGLASAAGGAAAASGGLLAALGPVALAVAGTAAVVGGSVWAYKRWSSSVEEANQKSEEVADNVNLLTQAHKWQDRAQKNVLENEKKLKSARESIAPTNKKYRSQLQQLRDAQEAENKAVDKYGEGSLEAMRAAERRRQKERELQRAALDSAEADLEVTNQTGKLEDARKELNKATRHTIALEEALSDGLQGLKVNFNGVRVQAVKAGDKIQRAVDIAGSRNTRFKLNGVSGSLQNAVAKSDRLQSSLGNLQQMSPIRLQGGGNIGDATRIQGGQGQLRVQGGRQHGGRVMNAGNYLVGERGPEVVHLPQGSEVSTNEETRAMAGGTEVKAEVTVNLGMFSGQESEKSELGSAIWNSIVDVAEAQGVTLSGQQRLQE